MKYYMGYKLEEIAQILDLSIGTVKGKMYTALKNMRKELSDSENSGFTKKITLSKYSQSGRVISTTWWFTP